jgi:hypothetical protein
MATMLVALALTLACLPQEATTEQAPDPLCDPVETDAPQAQDALEFQADRTSADLERRFLAACAAFGGAEGMESGRAAAADVFLAQFLALAREGNPRAVVWCLEHQEAWRRQGAPGPAQRALRRELWETLLACASRQESLLNKSRVIQRLSGEQVLARGEAAGLAERFAEPPLSPGLRAMAIYSQARLIAPWDTSDSKRVEEAVTLLHRAMTMVPDGDPLVERCRDTIFRLQELAIGCEAPSFTSEDAHGNEIRLDDYLGKVVLIRFWSFLDERARERLEADRLRVREHWDERFALVGVNDDSDCRAFLDRCEAMEIHWPNAREGANPCEGSPIWHVDSPGTILLDEKGIVRSIDLEGRALDVAIDDLVRDLELARAAESRTASSRDAVGNQGR